MIGTIKNRTSLVLLTLAISLAVLTALPLMSLPGLARPKTRDHRNAAQPDFGSIDSAPPGFAVQRSAWVAPAFLATFAAVSAMALLALPELESAYGWILKGITGIQARTVSEPVSLRFRPFFGAFSLTFWMFAAGGIRERLRLFGFMLGGYVAASLASDFTMLLIRDGGGPGPFSVLGNIVSGFACLAALIAAILASIRLPAGVHIPTRLRRSPRYTVSLGISIVCAVVVVAIIFLFAEGYVNFLRDTAILGGLGPGILLFNPILWMILAVLALVTKQRRPVAVPSVSVAFLIPAYNEVEAIGDCIRSLDAAANCSVPCRIYVVDNGSTDGTGAVAMDELRRCQASKGEVLSCGQIGKAAALNLGLDCIEEDIVVRVDADTVVLPSLLQKLLPHFSDPDVGGAGGLPLPRDESFLLAKMRAIEVYYNIGFLRVAQGAIDAVMVIPGILSAYRRSLLIEVGGFAEGLNGEDTDMTVRIGRLGYRIVADPSIHVFSEVPRTLGHLREQRLRWTRGFVNVISRNKSAIWTRQGTRGVWTLPYAFFNAFRRVIVVPVMVYAAAVALVDPSALFLRDGAAVAAMLVGPALPLTLGVLLAYRRPDLVPFIPAYLFLRLIRAYLSLEMMLTLPLRTAREPRAVRTAVVAVQGGVVPAGAVEDGDGHRGGAARM